MGKYFGTDGVRGLANRDLTPELAFKLGRAVATAMQADKENRADRLKVVIGRDTRISGTMLEAALAAGFCSVGVDVVLAGVIPTPGIAFLTAKGDFDGGVVISASHNPAEDNGIKFFGSTGYKLPDEQEEKIEDILFKEQDFFLQPTGEQVGRISYWHEAKDRYAKYVTDSVTGDFRGMKVVLDCANGATSSLAPMVFSELGAEVVVLAGEPDGVNINLDCGSTHPELLQQQVVAQGADLGLAFDGDGDRVLAVDHQGNLIDGDHILLILANQMKQQGSLPENLLVVTVMSNLGLFQAAEKLDIKLVQTKVGDRYVLEEMLKSGSGIGGEQSGHIILLQHNTTGDGMLTGVQLLSILKNSGKSLLEQAGLMQKLPQVLVNVRVKDKRNLNTDDEINKVIADVESALAGRGRLLVRPSGTEPLVRVMAEGPDEEELNELVNQVAKVVEARL